MPLALLLDINMLQTLIKSACENDGEGAIKTDVIKYVPVFSKLLSV
jgi:hypothetical protein